MMNCKCFQAEVVVYFDRLLTMPTVTFSILTVFCFCRYVKKKTFQNCLKTVSEFRVIGWCTHRSLFDDSVEHYNSFGTLLPNHQPKMAAGISQRPLCRQRNVLRSLQWGFLWNNWFINSIQNIITDTLLFFYPYLRKNVGSFCFLHHD